jgi:mono/diheme cytochrome c family protein
MPRAIAAGLAAAALASMAGAAPPRYVAPPETAQLAPGPDVETAQAHCLACHSADYVTTQPRGFAQPTLFWTAEVNKMKKAYGARLTDDESARIVAYLVAAYGK